MFGVTLTQMAVLAIYMIIGFVVAKLKVVPENSTKVLSRLENTVFIPALVLVTFITNFTTKTLSTAWQLLVLALIVVAITIPVSILIAKIATKNGYLRKIYTYAFSFSNFGFMGNAIVLALFPQYISNYIIFTLPLWTAIYVWGAPFLLMSEEGEQKKKSIGTILKALINPMFISLLIGAIIGITGLGAIMPSFILEVMTVCKDCMSPIAMIMTGMTFAVLDFKKLLTDVKVYILTFVRLIVVPLFFVGLWYLADLIFNLSALGTELYTQFFTFVLCAASMPFGLNTIVIPAAYGKDTSVAAGMALISHTLSIFTIPLIFGLFLG